MSKIFSKLKDLQESRNSEELHVAGYVPSAHSKRSLPTSPAVTVVQTVDNKPMNLIIVLGIIIALGIVLFLGSLAYNVSTIKNNLFFSMDSNNQKQENQIVGLDKKLKEMQSSMDSRLTESESTNKNLSKDFQAKLDDLNNNVQSKFDQNTMNMNRMEAVLQSNIDELNSKFNKLQQSSVPDVEKTASQNN